MKKQLLPQWLCGVLNSYKLVSHCSFWQPMFTNFLNCPWMWLGWPHMEVVLWYLKWSFRRVRHVKLFVHLNLIQDPHVNDPWNLYWFVKLEIIWQAQAYDFEESFHDLFLNLQTFQDIRLTCGVPQSHWHVGPAVKFPLRLDHCPTYVYWFVGHVWAKTWLGPRVRDIRGFNS